MLVSYRGAFWVQDAPAISHAYLQYRRLTNEAAYQQLKNLESVESGLVLQLARRAQVTAATGHDSSAAAGHPHKIRSDQSWMTVQGATSKAASPAGPPTSTAQSSTSVSGLTQQFEQLSVGRSSSVTARAGLIPNDGGADKKPRAPIVLSHDKTSMEPYGGNPFVNQEIVEQT